MHSYIPIYYRLRKREPLIALGFHWVGGDLTSASAVPHCGDPRKVPQPEVVQQTGATSLPILLHNPSGGDSVVLGIGSLPTVPKLLGFWPPAVPLQAQLGVQTSLTNEPINFASFFFFT